ncbi:MAG: proline hydroxylase [Myxococcaceae bacterium]|nr:MAG: proline hydroxylase [Myxococcaceae bacterium]
MRMAENDWTSALEATGHGIIPGLLGARECAAIAALYEEPSRFRSRVVMGKHGFGRGEYQYFAHPLPARVLELRRSLYAALVPAANRWAKALGKPTHYPDRLEAYLEQCHKGGQTRPTPLLLRYGPGDFNCLHQDLYGPAAFPFQVAVLLSKPETDFAGGEFVLTQQRPRMQSRVDVVPLQQGDAVAFAVNERPVQGTRGVYRVRMRHGVSEVRSGQRHTLGIIFHDAE